MKPRTISEFPRLAIVALQFGLTFILWVRVEALAEMLAEISKSAKVNAEIAAKWAQALSEDARLK